MNNIAIANVPIQKWEEPLPLKDALYSGTIFPGLIMPFFIEEQMPPREIVPKTECEALLSEINKTSFFLTDLELYIDMHPQDSHAFSQKEELIQKRKTLMQEFAEKYYPLTCDCIGKKSDGPAPWEGVC